MKQQAGQMDFSGGANERLAPEFIGENQYVTAENIEIRDKYARTRRGSRYLTSYSLLGTIFQGMGLHRDILWGTDRESILSVVDGTPYCTTLPEKRVTMTLPSGIIIGTDKTIRFIEAYGYSYMLRGEDEVPLRWDGNPNNAWTVVPIPAAGDPMPNAGYGIYAYNRIWLVTGDDTIDISDDLSDAFELNTQSWDIESGEGGQIMFLYPFADGRILVGKTTGIGVLSNCNGDLTQLTFEFLTTTHGATSRDGVMGIGADVWFMSQDGIRSVMLTQQNYAQLVDEPLTAPIPTTWKRINQGYACKTQCVYYDSYFIAGVPIDTAETINAMLVYDLLNKTWLPLWTGFSYIKNLFVTRKAPSRLMSARLNVYSVEYHIHLEDLYYDAIFPFQYMGLNGSGYYEKAFATTSYGTDASGNISMRIRCTNIGINAYAKVAMFTKSGGMVTVAINPNAKLVGASWMDGTHIWEVYGSGCDELFDYGYHVLSLNHDGTYPTWWLDGNPLANAYVVSGGWNAAHWLNDISGGNGLTVKLSESHALAHAFNCEYIRYASTDGATIGMHVVPFTMELVRDLVSATSFTTTGSYPSVGCLLPSNGSPIVTILTSRGFHLNAIDCLKHFLDGEITFGHRGMNLTVSGIVRDATDALLLALNYDQTKYDYAGVDDFAYTMERFNEEGRQEYAPVSWPTAGITMGSYGASIDREQTHTVKFFSGRTGDSIQFTFSNASGSIALKQILVKANVLAQGQKEGQAWQ